MAFHTIVLIFCSLLLGCAANVLWDNNYNPNWVSGTDKLYQIGQDRGYDFSLLDDFQLQVDVNSLTVEMLVATDPGVIPTNIIWTIYSDNNGDVGNMLHGSTAYPVRAQTGRIIANYLEWTLKFEMTGISLSRQTTYWMQLGKQYDLIYVETFSSNKLSRGYLAINGGPSGYLGDINYRLTDGLQNGVAHGDPIIYGFHGSKFWFNGHAGGIFNIYNDEFVNVNSLFALANKINGTVMEMIALEMSGHRISFNIKDPHDSKSMNIVLDGKNTTISATSILNLKGCVEIGMKPKYLSIRTPKHDIKIRLGCPTGDGYITVDHLDFEINPPKKNVHQVGGVIGQTASDKSDREDSHFIVSDLYGTEKSAFYKKTSFVC